MKKTSKIFALLVTLTILLSLFPTTALAADVEPLNVNQGTSTISASGRLVTFAGISRSAVVEDNISVYIYLQELQNGSWVTISSGLKSADNAMSVSQSKTVTVTGGKYYRTMSRHMSITGGYVTSFYSYSSEKWVS